jgi:hypothetical protein
MKRSLILILSLFLTFIVAPSAQADCLVWNETGNCIQEDAVPENDPQWEAIRNEFANDPQYSSLKSQVGSDVYVYTEAERQAAFNQWATNTLRQRATSAAQQEVQNSLQSQAAANPGQEVCGSWSSGNQTGGMCMTIPLAARTIDSAVASSKISAIRAQLESDPQYATLRYGIGNQTFDYTPAERAALLDQWASNMAGNELAKEAASKKAAKNPGLRVCSDWAVGGQSGQQCDYVPVALTSKAILSSVTEQLDGLELSAALDKKINKFVKAVDVAIPNTTSAKTVTIPKAPKGLTQVITVENPDDCSAKGRKVKIDKGALCEISIALTVAQDVEINFAQTVKRR